MESSEYFQYRRQIRSRHKQLDSHQHHERAYCPIRSQGNLDRQRNDRLGRIQRRLFEHWRKILRATRPAKSNTNGNRNSDCDADSDANTKAYTGSARSANSGAASIRMLIDGRDDQCLDYG
jgi:hypothetical protein